ncbi:hypothetical protein PQX77_011208 [Marasmius sp. AFHP31]|nr:hypothetical protein PQX77_011208 [Marasmius sp. AFHP31]
MFNHYQSKGMPPAIQGVPLTNQTIIITGANTGLGFEAAKHFAPSRSGEADFGVKAETGLTGDGAIEFWTSDLGSFESVLRVKEKIDALERLDVLVENAGVAVGGYERTRDGWENTLQINLLSPALRIILHLPKLIETARKHPETVPRIVYVSSAAHFLQTISTEAIDAPNTLRVVNEDRESAEDGTSLKRYGESKLLAQSFIRALQPHLPTVTCCSVAPGFCDSELRRNFPSSGTPARKTLAYTSEEGSRQLLYAAIGERDREDQIRGSFMMYNEISECSDFLLGEGGKKLERKLWEEILGVVGSVDGEVKEVVEKYLS